MIDGARSKQNDERHAQASKPARRLYAQAGHAIIQLVYAPHQPIESISVEEVSADTLGRVETQSLWQPSYMTGQAVPEVLQQWGELAWRDIIFYLAGPIAELRWRKHPRAEIWFGAEQMAERCLGADAPDDNTDFGRVRRRLTYGTPGDDRVNFNKAWLEAEEKVALWVARDYMARARA